jgi:hypothetical protein
MNSGDMAEIDSAQESTENEINDDENIDADDVQSKEQADSTTEIQSTLLSFVCALGSKPSMTMTKIFVIEQLQEILSVIRAQCCDSVNDSLRNISAEARNEIKNKILA